MSIIARHNIKTHDNNTDDILAERAMPKSEEELGVIAEKIAAEYDDPNSDFNVLNALIDGLRSRLPQTLTPAQFDQTGDYMLKAYWLGQGKDLELVLSVGDPTERHHLTLVK